MNTASTQELERLLRLGVALSAERNLPRLLCRILSEAQDMTGADGGTLYLLGEDGRSLDFAIIRNRTLGIAINACGEVNQRFEPVPLQDARGQPNHANVASHVALIGKPVVIDDVYAETGYDLEGVRRFDRQHGYRTRSLLTLPMRDHEDTVIGVLQLINRMGEDGAPESFRMRDILLAEALASQAAVTLANRRLIQGLEDFIDAFVRVIATAIDEKNPHTANHCKRVPEITLMLAEAASRTEEGPLAEFRLTDRDRREIELAAWLHDCGKIATPEYILDKATKLHTLYDRIGVIDTRFAVLRQQTELEFLQAEAELHGQGGDEMARRRLRQEREAKLAELEEERQFLHRCNRGTEFMGEADRERVRRIGRRTWRDAEGRERPLLTEEEMECLTIPRGTLTPREREIINNHIVVTQRMLEQLPFPRHLRNIPEYAGGHHERVDGRGYPNGLTRDELSIPARIMAIADIFEALTDRDRPYKTGKTLTEALDILRHMRDDGHIDPDLYEVFVREQVYLEYARKHLAPEQIDLDAETEQALSNIKIN